MSEINETTNPITPPIPTEMAILPLFNTIVYPMTVIPLAVGQPESIHLIDDSMVGERVVGLMTIKNEDERPSPVTPADFYHIGTAAIVHKLMKLPDGTLRVAVQGLERIEIEEIIQTEPYYRARIRIVPDVVAAGDSVETEALMRSIVALTTRIAPLIPQFPEELLAAVVNEDDPRRLAYLVASYVRMSIADRQNVIAEPDVETKLRKLNEVLSRELSVLEIGQQIQSQVQTEMGKTQRDYVLREQLKAIRKELGEENEQDVEADRLATAIEAAGMHAEAKAQATRELERLRQMPPSAAEYGVIRTYLETLIDLPWQKRSDDHIDITEAAKILDADHYALGEIKERILDFLAVRELRRQRSPEQDAGRGAILCFVGPPGVGKTSLGRSIARAMNREFIRISLGGVRDEAEIRGHRRTYIGAMPGSLIQAIRRVGVNNPVFMLDEIDKLGADYRGDPTSAMLEVLDPEQNNTFRDHYLDVGWDLSSVMFIATANTLQTIPAPLRDRLEIIQLAGYTVREKLEIARRYLVPEQIERHSLRPEEIALTDEALLIAIEEYTREAGVRTLEQQIGTLVRKAARRIAQAEASGTAGPVSIDAELARDFLGRRRFYAELSERTDRPGVVTGLVWTPVGGDIIFIEATKMRGGRGFMLTGQLGDVMKESARAALSWVRAEGERYGIDPNFYTQYDIHMHVPAGAQPKDGPSAGIAMVTALVSLLSGRPVRDDLAMTGEVTLRGKVLPIGGLKEKVLAAHRAGIRTIIVPERNRFDLDDLPEDLIHGVQFVFVENVGQVLDAALREEATELPVIVDGDQVTERERPASINDLLIDQEEDIEILADSERQ
ncbi:MAG: endopeptidase La [Herpetosiphonaceae bacterium]|nr:endopeptidase La [Herpetosiphonaceae bacterium]